MTETNTFAIIILFIIMMFYSCNQDMELEKIEHDIRHLEEYDHTHTSGMWNK